MLDLKFVRENPKLVEEAVKSRNGSLDLTEFLELDKQRREITQQVEALKKERNTASQEIGKLKKAGQDAAEQMAAVRALGDKIAADDKELKEIEEKIKSILLTIPNVPAEDVPVGKDDTCNPVIRTWGEPTKFDFEPKAHWDIGENLGILDFERGVKVSGARYVFYRGMGSRLERAVINFFLDVHTRKHGYTEFFPPFIVNGASMQGTGQLPKFAEDMYKLENGDMYLIPTAEVPVTNYHRDDILTGDELPLKYTAYSACFRAEAGAAGRDTRTMLCVCALVTWASAPLLHMTSKYGCRQQTATVKFLPAPTSWTSRHAVPTSASVVMQNPNRNLYIPLTAVV